MSNIRMHVRAIVVGLIGVSLPCHVSARGSMFWDGRFHVDESKSNLPQGAAWGTALDVGLHPVVFMAQLLQTGGLTSVDTRLCVWMDRIWIACARGDCFAETWEGSGFERSVLVAGLSVGVFPFGY